MRWRWVMPALLGLVVSDVAPAPAQLGGRTARSPRTTFEFEAFKDNLGSVADVFAMRAHPFVSPPAFLDGAPDPRTLPDLRAAITNAKEGEIERLELRVCEALERDLVVQRARLAAPQPTPAARREQLGRFLDDERALGHCLEALVDSSDAAVQTLALHRLAHYHANIVSHERREDDRARAIVERLEKAKEPDANAGPAGQACDSSSTTVELDYVCGWTALRAGNFDVAAQRLGSVLATVQVDAAVHVRARVGWGLALAMTAPEEAIHRAIETAPAAVRSRIVQSIVRGLRLAGRLDVSARIVDRQATAQPVGLARCRLLIQSASERSNVVEIDEAARALEAAGANLLALRRNPTGDVDRCEVELARTVRALAARWHREGVKTRWPVLVDGARRAYRVYIELFPAAPDIYDVRYHAAELAWHAADATFKPAPDWTGVASQFEAVVAMGAGRYTGDAAYATILALQNARREKQDVADLGPRLLASVRAYERVHDPKSMPDVWAGVGVFLSNEELHADGARLLARAIEADPEGHAELTARLVQAWAALGDWSALDAFLTNVGPRVIAHDGDLREQLDAAFPTVRAKVCESREADRAQAAACYRTLAADVRAGSLGAWAAARASQLDVKP